MTHKREFSQGRNGARGIFTHQLPFPIVKSVRTLYLQAAHVGTWEAGVAETKGCSVQRPEAGSLHLCRAGCQSNGIKSGPSLPFFSLKGQILNILSFSGFIWSLSHILLCYSTIL